MYESTIKVKLVEVLNLQTEEDPYDTEFTELREILTENLADKISRYNDEDLMESINSYEILQVISDSDTEYIGKARICAHDVAYRFWGDKIPEDIKSALDEEAEKRSHACITQNIVCGELNYEDENVSLRGWWEIKD